MNKHESEDASTQVTGCMTHWFLKIHLYIFTRHNLNKVEFKVPKDAFKQVKVCLFKDISIEFLGKNSIPPLCPISSSRNYD